MKFYEQKWFKITGIVLLVLLLGFSVFKMAKGEEEKKPVDEKKSQSEQVMDTEPESEEEPTVTVGEEPVDKDEAVVDETTSEEMARRTSCYEDMKFNLTIRPYSRKNLIKYMMSKQGGGYSKEDAEFAVTKMEQNKEVDWDEQCSRARRKYLGENSMPKDELIKQLSSDDGDGFTEEQAKKAIADWE